MRNCAHCFSEVHEGEVGDLALRLARLAKLGVCEEARKKSWGRFSSNLLGFLARRHVSFEGLIKLNTAFHFGIIQPKIDYTLKGKGMPYESNPSKFGDMIINFDINYPSKKLSKESTFEK